MAEDSGKSKWPSPDVLAVGCECPHFRYRRGFLLLLPLSVYIVCYMNLSELLVTWTLTWHRESGAFINETAATAAYQTLLDTTVSPVSGSTKINAKTLAHPPWKRLEPYVVAYPHEYHFILNEPERCQNETPFLVLMVPVAPKERAARDAIRGTWGGESLVLGKAVSLFFLLARPGGEGSEERQQALLQESREHRDLVQSDFLDSYHNLTIKSMVMLEWLSGHCPNASYAMKVDSDVFLNVPNLVKMLLNAPQQNYMTGIVPKHGHVVREPNSKFYLPKELFPEPIYPPYAMGLAYVFSLDLPRKLCEAAKHVKAIYIEDAYMGMCMRHLGIQYSEPPTPTLFNLYVKYPQSRCYYSKIITTIQWGPEELLEIWKELQKPGPAC